MKWKDTTAGGPVVQSYRKRRRLNADQMRALKAARFTTFARQYARKAQKGMEPNDRTYSREIEQAARRMDPEVLDRLLRNDDDGD